MTFFLLECLLFELGLPSSDKRERMRPGPALGHRKSSPPGPKKARAPAPKKVSQAASEDAIIMKQVAEERRQARAYLKEVRAYVKKHGVPAASRHFKRSQHAINALLKK